MNAKQLTALCAVGFAIGGAIGYVVAGKINKRNGSTKAPSEIAKKNLSTVFGKFSKK